MHNVEAAPLAGKRILVTRTREQASVLSEKLQALGAAPIEFPTIRIVPPSDWSALDAALRRLYASKGEGYDWLIFTSVNGVRICCERLQTLGYNVSEIQRLHAVRLATIGPATAAAAASYGLSADLVPGEYVAEGVIAALLTYMQERNSSIAGQRILLARAAEARRVLFTDLVGAGAKVDEVAAYDTLPVAHDDVRGHEVLHMLAQQQLDIVTFTSSSTVRNFVAWLKRCEEESALPPGTLFDRVKQHTRLASIGPITSQTAQTLGLRVDIEAQEYTIDGLVDAILQHEGVLW